MTDTATRVRKFSIVGDAATVAPSGSRASLVILKAPIGTQTVGTLGFGYAPQRQVEGIDDRRSAYMTEIHLPAPGLDLDGALALGERQISGPGDSLQAVYLPLRSEDVALSFMSIQKRLNELAALQDGWLDGDAVSVEPAAVNAARHTLVGLVNLGVPEPRIFATPDGGVQAEWTTGRAQQFESSLTVEPDGSASALVVDIRSGEAVDLDPISGLSELASFVAPERA
jgi:hypothetical protein